MKALKTILVALVTLSLCSITSAAEFWDDFESYAPGSGLHGQGGWEGWDNDAAYGSPASGAYAYSGSVSVEIISSADLVQPFTVAGGKWVLSTMMYAPSGGTGNTMFIVLNQYPNDKDWSVQTTYNLDTGAITSAYDTETGAMVFDQWVEVKLVIDLDNNTVDEYYNGQLLFSYAWDDDPASPPGIGCLDLYGNGASSVYYDDLLLIDVATMPSDPSPADGAEDVARDALVSWTGGTNTTGYDVYLGTDLNAVALASRANPMGVLVGQNQPTASFDPAGLLEFGAVYAWRVDAVRADGTIDKGPVWTFTAEPYMYVLQDVLATTNAASLAGQGPENTVNGSGLNENGQHSTDTSQMWLAVASGDDAMYIQFELDDVYPLAEMHIWNHNFIFELQLGLGIKDATVEYSTDGVDWTVLDTVELGRATGMATYTYNTTIAFDGTPAKFVRLIVESAFGTSGQFGLSEVRFMYSPKAAGHPVPADGATNVDVNTELSWRAGREAAKHDVYLGTDVDALPLLATVVQNRHAAALDLNTTYAWRIDEVNEAETPSVWPGRVWSFTTQEYLVVDDFEGYSDDWEANEAIWQTWIDGWEDNSNGSQVGYTTSPFAEQTIVYDGGQSMPLAFDNTAASHSEATRTFASAQNWSQHGITTLSLRFKGGRDLAATERLYVKVNGTKVVYDGDLTGPVWLPFNVDLASLGVNLNSVRTLTVGVEGTSSGMLFVDSIALYRTAPVEPSDKTLVGHWKLDETEGLTAADSSGYGHDGTLMGLAGTEWTTGINGGALAFAGGSAANPTYVNFGNTPNLQINGSVTMSAWVKMDANKDGVYMGIGGKLISGTYRGFALVRHSSNVFRLWANSADNQLAGFEASSDVTYTDTEWHHVCGVVDAGTSMLYVDGVKQAQEGTVDLVDSTTYAYIGKQYGDESSHRYWNGLIDDVRIYYRALSAQEIAGL